MATRTVRAHVEKALRATLRINAADARSMISTIWNERAVSAVRVDLRDCFAIVNELRDVEISVFSPETGVRNIAYLRATAHDLRRWDQLPLEEAYALPEAVGRHLAEQARTRAVPETEILDAGDFDYEEMLRDIPEAKSYAWRDGSILSVETLDGHAQVRAEIDGVVSTYAMIPLFGTPSDVAEHAADRIGQPARLCVENPHADHREHRVPEGMAVIDMIVPANQLHSLRRAA